MKLCLSCPSRRNFLSGSLASLALGAMLARDGVVRANPVDEWQPPDGKPHFAPKAKSVIWLFMNGGVSHMESFDPKPELQRLHGQPLPASFGTVMTRRAVERNRLRLHLRPGRAPESLLADVGHDGGFHLAALLQGRRQGFACRDPFRDRGGMGEEVELGGHGLRSYRVRRIAVFTPGS